MTERNPHIKLIDEVIYNMLDVLTSEEEHTRIKRQMKKTEIVKSVYLKLKYAHIQYVVDRFRTLCHTVVHKASYLKTLLYTSLEEMESYYQNEYNSACLL